MWEQIFIKAQKGVCHIQGLLFNREVVWCAVNVASVNIFTILDFKYTVHHYAKVIFYLIGCYYTAYRISYKV